MWGFKSAVLTGAICLASILARIASAQTAPADSGSLSSSFQLPGMTVIGNTPLPGSGIDIDKVPGNVETLSAGTLYRDGQTGLLPGAAARNLSSVNLNSQQGSSYQPDFVYRGFEASPIQGVAQGLAVYQNGVRINEAFGDIVNWELIPQFAVNQMTIQSNNPVFGLNALGGAVAVDMKNGFNFHGTNVQVGGGSFGNFTGFAESGVQVGDVGLYGAIGGVHDGGYRELNQSGIGQGYFDLGWEKNDWTVHLSVSAAHSSLAGTGPTPVQLLNANIASVFTNPQSIQNEAELVQLTSTYRVTDDILASGNVYYRHYRQNVVDGNTTDVVPCTNNAGFFCLEGSNLFPDDVLFDSRGNQVPTGAVPLTAADALGEIDFTTTDTNTVGAGLQVKFTNAILSRPNNLVVGATIDHSLTSYTAQGELGAMLPSLEIIGSGIIIDQGLSPTASPPIEQPVDVSGTNTYYGVYATDTLDITPSLSATLSGRVNLAEIGLTDLSGQAPAVTGNHFYGHFNPGLGLTYKVTDNLTLYGGWSESNRAPTPAELTCSDPARPCILDAFLVADPALKQVVSQTFEVGARGHFETAAMPGQFLWHVGAYRTDSNNDIQLLGTAINGFGFFDNVGTTRRQGVDASLAWHWDRWTVSANYSYLSATFLENLVLSSNSPAADADGLIFVHPGDHIPLTPSHRLVLNAEYSVTPRWKLGGDLRFVSSQYLFGDESNQEPKLPDYVTLDLHTSYRIVDRVMLFAEINNLAGARYFTYGTFGALNGLPPNFNLTNPRLLTPAPGRAVFGGIRVSF